MHRKLVSQFAARLLRQPTAPYHEHAVRAEAESICAENGLRCRRDRFGNLLVRLNNAPKRRPLVLAAHLDHPGFEILRLLPRRRWLARFRGGVPDRYFRPGLRVRLMPGDVPAKIARRVNARPRTFELACARPPVEAPTFAMWDLPAFALRGRRLYSRACDDIIGSASVLATLVELKRRRARVHVLGLLSRAEEVGFHGALAAAAEPTRARVLPPGSLVISLETSRELPGVQIGNGVIIRVGDRTSIFNPEATRFLAEVAAGIKTAGFQFQRALMSGGTCEASAFQELGFQCAAVCVGLGNYHNCGVQNRIAAEYVDLNDVATMVELLAAAARAMPKYRSLVDRFPARLRMMLREARPGLIRTA